MSLKLNHFICPNCGHDFYAEGASVACDACQCCFYASQSHTCNLPKTTIKPTTGCVDQFRVGNGATNVA
jgi:predicted amidophosphoribosyltransferase